MRSRFFQLQQRVPLDQFYRYNDLWKWSAIQLVFSAALIQFTLRGTLISSGEIDRLLCCAIGDEQTTGKHIDIEEYLLGLCQLSQFLARLAVNSVIAGRLQRPAEVLAFLSELLGALMGFSFRNDQLRKRFDGMKYDVMKVEEVVYDLSVRGFPIVSAEAGATALDLKKRPKVET
ncbi:hypothetical protein SARC_12251 [Sphaeroforma arctica JP610]|uniref:Translin n=1 Tax=Sphaeroforma arctica JP610 TaxID=667725 RepID=A0A0L0FFH6_9EUKA|nr:hypothetical protein SARC_12251 [Sphaeroforma arctica JP610]KNC75216.1 hypothetical protein SARC_12251 [Sphaeroforma arctica JP610]|eukprot:XP_014149118.1 hypothetical protein SARC_12251 [Sphaeroforma arctica JP610]